MTNPDVYRAEVFWSDEDRAFIAIAPDLPGCSAAGGSRSDALDELQHAIQAWIAASIAAGNEIPAPSIHPALATYSGKFVLRLPTTMHAQLAMSAQREGVSLNQYVVALLASAQNLQVVEERIARKADEVGSVLVAASIPSSALQAAYSAISSDAPESFIPVRWVSVHESAVSGYTKKRSSDA